MTPMEALKLKASRAAAARRYGKKHAKRLARYRRAYYARNRARIARRNATRYAAYKAALAIALSNNP